MPNAGCSELRNRGSLHSVYHWRGVADPEYRQATKFV